MEASRKKIQVQNIYRKQNSILEGQASKIHELLNEIRCLNEHLNFLNQKNQALLQENNKLHLLVSQLRSANTHLNSVNAKIEQEKQFLLENLSSIQKGKQSIENFFDDYNRLKMQICKLKKENHQLLLNLKDYNNQIEELNKEQKELLFIRTTTNKLFDVLYQNLIQNSTKRRNNYPVQICDILTIISFVGKNWYSILRQIFDLPCFRTVQRYRKNYLEKFNISNDIFDGSIEHLNQLINIPW